MNPRRIAAVVALGLFVGCSKGSRGGTGSSGASTLGGTSGGPTTSSGTGSGSSGGSGSTGQTSGGGLTCALVGDAGCASGESCQLTIADDGAISTACGVPGSGTDGAPCTATADCADGFTCIGQVVPVDGGEGAGHVCRSTSCGASCSGAHACFTFHTLDVEMITVCLGTQWCTPGTSCTVAGEQCIEAFFGNSCVPFERGALGSSCSASSQCFEGGDCDGTCVERCSSDSDCIGSDRCIDGSGAVFTSTVTDPQESGFVLTPSNSFCSPACDPDAGSAACGAGQRCYPWPGPQGEEAICGPDGAAALGASCSLYHLTDCAQPGLCTEYPENTGKDSCLAPCGSTSDCASGTACWTPLRQGRISGGPLRNVCAPTCDPAQQSGCAGGQSCRAAPDTDGTYRAFCSDQTGQFCADSCSNDLDCNQTSACVAGSCRALCDSDADCGAATGCSGQGPSCTGTLGTLKYCQ